MIGICAGLPFAYGYTTASRLRPDAPAVAAAMVNACGLTLIVACIPLIGLTFSLPGHGRIGFWAAAGLWLGALALLPPRRDEWKRCRLLSAHYGCFQHDVCQMPSRILLRPAFVDRLPSLRPRCASLAERSGAVLAAQ